MPFGKVSKELGRKLLHEVMVLDIRANVPIISIQPFSQNGYDYAVKIRTMNVADHNALQRMASYQVRKYNACRQCLKCESVCPYGAISISLGTYKIDENVCYLSIRIEEQPALLYRNKNGGNLLFRPIGQRPFVLCALKLFDKTKDMKTTMQTMNRINFDIDSEIWKFIVWK